GSLQGYSDAGVNKQRLYSPAIGSKDSQLWLEAYAPSGKAGLIELRTYHNGGNQTRLFLSSNAVGQSAGIQGGIFVIEMSAGTQLTNGGLLVGLGTMPAAGAIKATSTIEGSNLGTNAWGALTRRST